MANYEYMLERLKERKGYLSGIEKDSVEYKINKIEEILSGVDYQFMITTTRLVSQGRLIEKINKEKNFIKGYKKLLMCDNTFLGYIEDRLQFNRIKVMLYEKELPYYSEINEKNNNGSNNNGNNGNPIKDTVINYINNALNKNSINTNNTSSTSSSTTKNIFNIKDYTFQKTNGSLSLNLLGFEMDPIFEVSRIEIYVDLKLSVSLQLSKGTKADITFENTSEMEIFLLGANGPVLGVLYLPCEFFVDKNASVLELDFRNFNYLKIEATFNKEIRLVRQNAKILYVYKEGHELEDVYTYAPRICGVCERFMALFSYAHRCRKCKFTSHKTCTDWILFHCKNSLSIEVDKEFKKSYDIPHVLVNTLASGFRYCSHCGDRINTANKVLQCRKCVQRFHGECEKNIFNSCGITLDLRKSMAEFIPPIPKDKKPLQTRSINDYQVIRVLGKGNFGKVLLVQERSFKVIKKGHKVDEEKMHKQHEEKMHKQNQPNIHNDIHNNVHNNIHNNVHNNINLVALKILRKEKIVNISDVAYIEVERKVLELASYYKHPFLMKMYYCFQDSKALYFGCEYLAGGDLFAHTVQNSFGFSSIRLYASEILLALDFLHNKHYIYRDLKLDNILLGEDGHVKICDFGLCKEGIGPLAHTYTYCGTLDTIAPEIIQGEPYTKAVDWWSYGVVLYELYERRPPFTGATSSELSKAILRKNPSFRIAPPEARDLINRLLCRNPQERYGFGPGGVEKIKKHVYFQGVNWKDVYEKKQEPEFKPGSFSSKVENTFLEESEIISPSSANINYDQYFINFK